MTRTEFEAALDGHILWVKENWQEGPRWYMVRRNGKTKTWARDKNRWKIPVKWKLKQCFTIGDHNLEELSEYFRSSLSKPEHRVEGSYEHFNRYVAGDR